MPSFLVGLRSRYRQVSAAARAQYRTTIAASTRANGSFGNENFLPVHTEIRALIPARATNDGIHLAHLSTVNHNAAAPTNSSAPPTSDWMVEIWSSRTLAILRLPSNRVMATTGTRRTASTPATRPRVRPILRLFMVSPVNRSLAVAARKRASARERFSRSRHHTRKLCGSAGSR